MKEIRIGKLTLNVGAGSDQNKLKKGIQLLTNLTGIPPVKTITEKRLPGWKIRPGLPIGCKNTLRGKTAEDLIVRLLAAKTNKLKRSNFDKSGNVSFGIHEYIDVPALEYDPKIGIMGFEATVTLVRPGYRIKRRKISQRKIGKKHLISQEEAIEFFKSKFNIKLEE